MAQPVFVFSIDRAGYVPNLFSEKSAVAFFNATTRAGELVGAWTFILNSLSTKLPLLERPGPLPFLPGNTSIRNPVISLGV
jgi:hypothetical protein